MIDEPFPASFCTKELRNTAGESTLKPPGGLTSWLDLSGFWGSTGSCSGEMKRLKGRTSVPEALLLTFFPDLPQIIPVDVTVPHGTLEKTTHSFVVICGIPLRHTHSKSNSVSAPDLPFPLERSRASCSVLVLARWFRTHDVGFQLSQPPTYRLRKARVFPS